MIDSTQTIFSFLTLLGIGGLLGGYVTYFLDKKKEREFKVLEQKEKRYKSSLLFMDAYFEPKNIKYIASRESDVRNKNDVIEYLKMEYHEMLLYASKEVILSVKKFIENPNYDNFLKTIITMREDLSSHNKDLDIENISLKIKSK